MDHRKLPGEIVSSKQGDWSTSTLLQLL